MHIALSLRRQDGWSRDAIAQLQVAGDEIGVKVSQKYMLDLEAMLRGEVNILACVALRVDDCGRARLLVSNYIRGVRQARQVELLEDHGWIVSSWKQLFRLWNDPHIGTGRLPAAREPLFGFFFAHRRQDDDVFALLPVHRG